MIFKIKLNIIDKKKALESLYTETKNFGFKNPLVICDKIFYKDKYIQKCIKKFPKKFITFSSEPTYEQLDKELKILRKRKYYDCIIGIGGGSAIDFAKGLALLLKNPGKSSKYMGFPKNLRQPLPVIAIPTTVSTGSEIIFNAVFTDKRNKKKLGINTDLNYPVLSILDTNLIRKAPNEVIYQSAISSLMRSIETFTSVDSNNITKFFSLKSYEILSKTLSSKIKNDNYYRNLQWGCIFSMLALSNSSGGPCGVINYYFSVHFNIPQALSYNFTAIEFFKKNIQKGYFEYANLIDKNNNLKKIAKVNKFISNLKKIILINNKKIKLAKILLKSNPNLKEDIYKAFKNMNFVQLKKNPVKINKNDLREIIERIIK
jgi:alcohol dehydrogenase class IV